MTPDIGFSVALIRQARGMTQRELAYRAFTSRSHVSRIEIGVHRPTIACVTRLAHGLNVPAWVLMRVDECRQELRP